MNRADLDAYVAARPDTPGWPARLPAAAALPGPGGFDIEFELTGQTYPNDVRLVARCRCGVAYGWYRIIPGESVVEFARRHADCGRGARPGRPAQA